MPQALRKVIKWPLWRMPVSYNILDKDRMADARNVCTIQKILQTRPGTSRFNDTRISAEEILSISYFKDNAADNYVIAKVGRNFYKVPEAGVSTLLFGGFTLDEDSLDSGFLSESETVLLSTSRHRAITWNGRHIMAVGADGLYQYNGTTFTQIGQDPPSAPTAIKNEGGGTLSNTGWQVGITFYDSINGFETNISGASATITTDGGNDALSISNIDETAENSNIDKVRIYLKDFTAAGAWLFIAEINIGTTTYEITEDATSTQIPPLTNAAPLDGGAKYLTMFGDSLAYAGNSNFPSDVFFSEIYKPDAFDDTSGRTVLVGAGNGPITGLATGFYNNDNLNPYLCIFKKDTVEVYSRLGGFAEQSLVSPNVGAPSQDTIKVINGDVYFQSTKGFHVIRNGRLVQKKDKVFHLANGDIDNIFNDDGFTYALNKTESDNFFSVYYPVLDQYITFVKESGSTKTFKAYNYEFKTNGFRPYNFPLNIIDAEVGEDENGETVVLLATEGGYIMKHSIAEGRSDTMADGATQEIEVFGNFYWVSGDDMDATYNFGTFIARALRNNDEIEFKYFLNYEYDASTLEDFDFTKEATGFILDVSKLDEAILSDGRNILRYVGGIYKTSQSLLITFSHNVKDSNINLIESQLDFSKNGNSNL